MSEKENLNQETAEEIVETAAEEGKTQPAKEPKAKKDKKDKKVKEMLNNLKHGDRITTIGGIYGTITGIKDDTITLAVGQKGGAPMEMTVARWAIRQVEEVSVENEGEILA